MQTVTVSADALRQLLNALESYDYVIREMQVCRQFDPNNPIDTLRREFNAAAEVERKRLNVEVEL